MKMRSVIENDFPINDDSRAVIRIGQVEDFWLMPIGETKRQLAARKTEKQKSIKRYSQQLPNEQLID